MKNRRKVIVRFRMDASKNAKPQRPQRYAENLIEGLSFVNSALLRALCG